MKKPKPKVYQPILFIAAIAVFAFFMLRQGPATPEKRMQARKNLNDHDLRAAVSGMRLIHPQLKLNHQEKALVALGTKFFFDPGFSANGQISCATCHQPDKSFTDGLATAQGLVKTKMNTPTLINSYAGEWFFWNGRADSLEAQAMGPVENPQEHGFSRAQIALRINALYKSDYEKIFGSLPQDLPAAPTPPPANHPPLVSNAVSAYALATLGSPIFQKMILRSAQSAGQQPVEVLRRLAAGPDEKDTVFDRLSNERKDELNHVFANFSRAIAAFERTIKTSDTPFDRYADQLVSGKTPETALGQDFGEPELRGLRLFTGRGNCTLCHSGPRFTDEQFHNIGLMATSGDSIDFGRAQGMLVARDNAFNCHGKYLKQATPSESCLELTYLETENAEALGAFKTPTLRNLKHTAPYGHDGRFPRVMDILAHYNHLGVPPAVGHIEEVLIGLGFTNDELQDLESFMMSLNGSVTFDRGSP
jgi:cytochrome c peroxidase